MIFSIRSVERSDADQILGMSRSLMSETVSGVSVSEEFNLAAEQEAQWIQEHLEHPLQIILVAEHEERLIGILDFATGPSQRIQHHGDFGMSVVKEWRDLGVGTTLLGSLLEWATQNPEIEKVNLRVNASNAPALHVYKKFGFVQEGLQKKDLKLGPNLYVDTVLMGYFMKPEVLEVPMILHGNHVQL